MEKEYEEDCSVEMNQGNKDSESSGLIGKNLYGYCPVCGSPGKFRERRPNGDDRCERGHSYPSKDAKNK